MSAPFLMEGRDQQHVPGFDADIGLQIIDNTPGAGGRVPVAIAGDAGAATGVLLFQQLKAPALGAGGQPLQAARAGAGRAALDACRWHPSRALCSAFGTMDTTRWRCWARC